jgi:hypothetical protein
LDVFPISMKGGGQQMPYPRAHLDSRSFSAERESNSHRQDPTDELHRNKNRAWHWLLITQDCLDIRDTTPLGLWRKLADQQGSARGGDARNADDQRESD